VEGAVVAALWAVLEGPREGDGELPTRETPARAEITRGGFTWAVLPVWKPGQPKMAEKTTTSLRARFTAIPRGSEDEGK
jgi:hypothetical protein